MTSWTDLIDTDPMEAAKLWEENEKPPDDIPDIVRGTARTRWETELKTARLMSSLAALCESLADEIVRLHKYHPTYNLKHDRETVFSYVMEKARDEDGSRRFPEVK